MSKFLLAALLVAALMLLGLHDSVVRFVTSAGFVALAAVHYLLANLRK